MAGNSDNLMSCNKRRKQEACWAATDARLGLAYVVILLSM
jgi:hypothetical protein